jgi:hypothetical protein
LVPSLAEERVVVAPLEERRVELPERVLEELLLERVLVPLERVELLLEELVVAVPLLPFPFLRLVLLLCCTVPLERVLEELLERVLEPLERVLVPLERVELLPEELVVAVPLLLPFLRLPLCCWVVVLPPPERRDWARISGAMSMARASIREAANVINLLIAQIVLKVNGINNTLGKAS